MFVMRRAGCKGKATYRSLPVAVRVVETIDIEALRWELGPSRLSLDKDLIPELVHRGSFAREAASQADDGYVIHHGWL